MTPGCPPLPAAVVLAASPLDEVHYAKVYVLPELSGSFDIDLVLDARFDGRLTDLSANLPQYALAGQIGYRYYLDPWGRFSVGGYLGGGGAAGGDEDQPQAWRAMAGARVELRGFSPEFYMFALGLFVEGGPVFLNGGRPPELWPELAGIDHGWFWTVGLETGPGSLMHVMPAVFGVVTARLSLETMTLAGQPVHTLIGGLRFGLEVARDDPGN